MDIFPYMGTQCLKYIPICTRCIVGTVSVKEVTLMEFSYIYAGLLNWFLRLSVSNAYQCYIGNGY